MRRDEIFSGNLAFAAIAGGIAASVMAAVVALIANLTLSPISAPETWLVLPFAVVNTFGATLIGAIAVALLALGPLATLTFKPFYKRGVRSVRAYAALGALVASIVPLALIVWWAVAAEGQLHANTDRVRHFDLLALAVTAWFAVSGAIAGRAFARGVCEDEAKIAGAQGQKPQPSSIRLAGL